MRAPRRPPHPIGMTPACGGGRHTKRHTEAEKRHVGAEKRHAEPKKRHADAKSVTRASCGYHNLGAHLLQFRNPAGAPLHVAPRTVEVMPGLTTSRPPTSMRR